ncbi:unnamed protein product [Allacma fusca]|uniref:Proline-rich protein PRCC n=1 Tax=Allacma fusca TaxID=39272 RepID=A0A8J2JRY3_9HEXA|nr:unnamed protein product [Allacma fusca]
MMSLVAYGSDSSDDDNEEMEVDDTEPVTTAAIIKAKPSVENDSDSLMTSQSAGKFSKLPKPLESDTPTTNLDDEGPLLPKKVDYGDELEKPPGIDFKQSSFANLKARKVGGIMKISVPSLKDFESDPDDVKKTLVQPSKKKSGLFAILPEPKVSDYAFVKSSKSNDIDESSTEIGSPVVPSASSTTPQQPSSSKPRTPFVPHVVQQTLLGKRPTATKLEEIRAKYLRQEANVEIVSRKDKRKEESDEEDEPADFFSFAAGDETVPEDPSLRIPEYQPPVSPTLQVEQEETPGPSYDNYSDSSNAESVMQFIPQGKKSKKETINFIDVSADDLRPDSQEWVKNITAEDPAPRRSRDAPGGLTKRKHQITYLAFEAKEREQSLKAQWAQNRHNKRMTQSKYGF